MRPLDEVLAAARAHGLPHSLHSKGCARCSTLAGELDEWEAKFQADIDAAQYPPRVALARGKLASIRQLLGRGKSEPNEKTASVIRDTRAGIRVVQCDSANEMLNMLLPRPASPAMLALVEACEAAQEAIDVFLADQSYATDPRCGVVQPVTVDDCNELGRAFNLLGNALALARAELGEQPEKS